MGAVAELQRQRVVARRQRQIGFGLALAEVQRFVVGGDDLALGQRLAVDQQMMVARAFRSSCPPVRSSCRRRRTPRAPGS